MNYAQDLTSLHGWILDFNSDVHAKDLVHFHNQSAHSGSIQSEGASTICKNSRSGGPGIGCPFAPKLNLGLDKIKKKFVFLAIQAKDQLWWKAEG